MTKNELIKSACSLKALLECFAAVDPDNATALQDLPIALGYAARKAEKLYEALCEEVEK